MSLLRISVSSIMCDSGLYWMFRLTSELVSRSQIAAGFRVGFWSSRLSKFERFYIVV